MKEEFQYSPFFIAIGSTLITILILTYSLALLPVQRSIESFSKSISFIYRNDKTTTLVFIIISTFAIVAFLFGLNIKLFCISTFHYLLLSILLTGITLDLLRWYHQRITKLLEPENAIKSLVQKTFSFINKYHSRISFISKWNSKILQRIKEEEITPQDLEKVFYSSSNHIDFNIINKFSELTEIAIKALAKNEVNTVSICLDALAKTGDYFVKSRKGNIIYYPSKTSFLVSESNINNVLNNLYENILAIAQKSNLISNQYSSINCLRALKKVTDSISKNLLSDEIQQSKDMLFIPISYMANIIEEAQNHSLDDVVLQGCSILSQTLSDIYIKQHVIELDYKANELYIELLMKYITLNKQAYGNKVLEIMMKRLFLLIPNHQYSLTHTLKDIIEKLDSIFPFALYASKQKQKNLMNFDLSVPYNAANENSFLNFIRSSQILNKVDDKRWHVNPYHYFSKYNAEISMHFCSLGEQNDLGESVFLWHITYSIKEIIRIHLQLLQNPLTDIHNHIEDLFDQITRYLSFFWVATKRAEKINKYYAEEICDVICWTAFHCYQEDFYKKHIIDVHKVIDICISNLLAVIRDYIQKGTSKSPFDIADLILYLWMIRIAAASKNDSLRIKKIDKALNKLELHTNNENYLYEALMLKYKEFLERVFEEKRLHIYDFDKSICLLRELVKDESFFFTI
ncbi:hypothetical protein [Rosettibacter firmus]|uniref:hypothetical protein n=1 Tax=Rosettibacter firmus TaxID=3111522 RepID=UPI00336C17BD